MAGRSLSPINLLNTLQEQVEPSIIAHHQNKGPRPQGWKRPFVESSTATATPVILEDKVEVVEFPERDESVGEIMVSWIGVPALDFMGDLSLEVLGEYLTESAISPLYAELVEIEQPLCTGTVSRSPFLRSCLTVCGCSRHFLLQLDTRSLHLDRLPQLSACRSPRYLGQYI